MLPFKKDIFCRKTEPKKQPDFFQNSIAWMVSIEKCKTLANRLSSWTNLKIFKRLFAWQNCLD